MILILVAIIAVGVIAAMLLWYTGNDYDMLGMVSGVFGVIFAASAGLSAVVYAFAVWFWFSADYKAQIINREYGTKYTQTEVFYASDVIDTIRQLDRKRYEINGDIVRGKDVKP